MSKLGKMLLFAGCFTAGYFVGKGFVNKDVVSSKYEVVQREDNHFLRSKELDKSYVLREINREVYMGDLEHMINGVKEMVSSYDSKRWFVWVI